MEYLRKSVSFHQIFTLLLSILLPVFAKCKISLQGVMFINLLHVLFFNIGTSAYVGHPLQNDKMPHECQVEAMASVSPWCVRIGVYIFFPVAVFYFFNKPEFYEEYVIKKQMQLYPKNENAKFPKTKEEYEELRLKFLEARKNKSSGTVD